MTDIFNTDKRYTLIYADPPWSYRDKKCRGACARHYDTMSIPEICALPVNQIAKKDAILFMWATYPLLPEAMQVIQGWGFTYKTVAFQWIKKNKSGSGYFFGTGRWTRGNTEACLLATKGKPYKYVISKDISQLVITPIEGHSKKPDIVRDKIVELCGDHSRIELFARQRAAGWDAWGNEAPEEEQGTYQQLKFAYKEG